MARRTLLLGALFATQIALGCQHYRPVFNRPIMARCVGCTPGFQAPSAGPRMATSIGIDSGYGGCSSCGTTGGAYPIAGVPAHAPAYAYPAGYPGFTTAPMTVIPPPTVVKSGEAPMAMPPMTSK